MATELFMRKLPGGGMIPADGYSEELMEEIKTGKVYKVDFKSSRNYKFLQKAFVLVRYAYDIWEPSEIWKGVPVEKNLTRFREDLTIMAGFYDVVPCLAGGVKPKAKSWSFSEMPDDEDFSKLYNALLNVIIAKVCISYSGEELDKIVNSIIHGFG